MKKYVFLLLFLNILYSCTKNDEITHSYVQGTVISFYDSSVVVPSATVYLHRGQDRDLIDSTKSDAQGKFRIEFTPEKNIMFGITAKQEKYFESSKNYFYISSDRPFIEKLKVAAYPKSYIRVHVKDETNDQRYVGIRLNQTTFSPYRIVYGYPLDTTVIIEAFYKNSNMDWGFIYPNNIWGFPPKVIQLPLIKPRDTLDLNIKF
jgi:hypothetical protein